MRENDSLSPRTDPSEPLGITAAQQGVWYGQLVDPDSPKYNIGECFEIRGGLDEPLFAAALDRAVALCDSLNLEFVVTDETVRQQVVRRPRRESAGSVWSTFPTPRIPSGRPSAISPMT